MYQNNNCVSQVLITFYLALGDSVKSSWFLLNAVTGQKGYGIIFAIKRVSRILSVYHLVTRNFQGNQICDCLFPRSSLFCSTTSGRQRTEGKFKIKVGGFLTAIFDVEVNSVAIFSISLDNSIPFFWMTLEGFLKFLAKSKALVDESWELDMVHFRRMWRKRFRAHAPVAWIVDLCQGSHAHIAWNLDTVTRWH